MADIGLSREQRDWLRAQQAQQMGNSFFQGGGGGGRQGSGSQFDLSGVGRQQSQANNGFYNIFGGYGQMVPQQPARPQGGGGNQAQQQAQWDQEDRNWANTQAGWAAQDAMTGAGGTFSQGVFDWFDENYDPNANTGGAYYNPQAGYGGTSYGGQNRRA
jgi:hypothetical protein